MTDHDRVGDWLLTHAPTLSTTDPAAPFNDLEPIRDIVGNARVVGLGEYFHFTHEMYELKDRIMRFLVERMGFTVFTCESGWAEGHIVDEWLRTGEGDLNAALVDGFSYRWGACEEMRSVLLWMRAHSSDPARPRPLRYAGIDISFSFTTPPYAIEGAFAYLDRVDHDFARHLKPRIDSIVARFVDHDRPPPPTSLSPVTLESFGSVPQRW